MPRYLWSFEDLSRFTRYEDPEVRYWAADRLILLYPEAAADAVADLLFDDHDSTPTLVATHLGERGGEAHKPLLRRGFRRASGAFAGWCLNALARLGDTEAPGLAREALHRRDLGEDALGPIVAGLAEMAVSRGSEEAADAAREILMRRPEIYADPLALKGCLKIFGDDLLGDLAERWITALHFRGLEPAEAGIRAIQEDLQLEDIAWCLRTDRSGRIDLDRSFRAVENGLDCDVRGKIPREERDLLSGAVAAGEFGAMTAGFAALVASRARALAAEPGDPLPSRLAALASGFGRPDVLKEAERLGHPFHTWLISLLLSALVKTAGYRNLEREAARAEGDLGALLALAEIESSHLVKRLPPMLAAAARAEGRDRLEQWCGATMEARGPFYPKATAIATIGEAAFQAHLPLVIGHLADDNSLVYATAEKALQKFGDEGVDAIRGEMSRQRIHPDAMHSVLVVLADLMTPAALALALEHLDDFMEAAGPDEGAEHAAMFGARDLIPHFRRWLKRVEGSTSRVALEARIGHSLLLVGAIHNVAIPEEEKILQAIEDFWKEAEDAPGGAETRDPWVM